MKHQLWCIAVPQKWDCFSCWRTFYTPSPAQNNQIMKGIYKIYYLKEVPYLPTYMYWQRFLKSRQSKITSVAGLGNVIWKHDLVSRFYITISSSPSKHHLFESYINYSKECLISILKQLTKRVGGHLKMWSNALLCRTCLHYNLCSLATYSETSCGWLRISIAKCISCAFYWFEESINLVQHNEQRPPHLDESRSFLCVSRGIGSIPERCKSAGKNTDLLESAHSQRLN